MATAKWNTPSSQGADIAGATLTSLANGATSAFVTHDNSTNLDLYANVVVALGALTTTTGASLTLRIFSMSGSDLPDESGGVGGGDAYTEPLVIATTAARKVVFRMVRLYPFSLRLCVTNNAGNALASSGNSIKVHPFNEQVV